MVPYGNISGIGTLNVPGIAKENLRKSWPENKCCYWHQWGNLTATRNGREIELFVMFGEKCAYIVDYNNVRV